MRIKPLILSLLIVTAILVGICGTIQEASAQQLLLDDTAIFNFALDPDDYQFDIKSDDNAVVGIRPAYADDFDIEVYTDTTFATLIESSTTAGETVDFVVLDKTKWTSPPNRGAIVTSGTTNYTIEMENDVDDHLAIGSWDGAMFSYPVLNRGPPGSWDDQYAYYPTVLYDGITFHMWYSGKDGIYNRIGYATSPDGVKWTKHPSNPLLYPGPFGSWENFGDWAPTVFYDSMTSTYKMWYSGTDGTIYKIGYATSPDGIAWTKYAANPVLYPAPSPSWDDFRVYTPMVYYDGITYHMWYAGNSAGNTQIGYATSPNGIAWTKYAANPVLNLGPAGSWDDTHVFTPMVLYDGAIYQMWYSASDGANYRIGYATSLNGITWTKYPSNPVLDLGPPGSWDETNVETPAIIYDPIKKTYHMWYFGCDFTACRIGYASSPDGVNWTKIPSEVIDAYEITGMSAGSFYTINLDVPATLDLDLFIFNATGARINALAASTNEGAGVDELMTFTAPTTGDYLLVITNENGGTGTYTISFIDDPPTITIYEPGSTSGQTYTQGDMITVTWAADDDKPLPPNPINISYGVPLSGWTIVSMNEANDGTYPWNTASVPCPGTYWMRLSVYDSIGQTAFDESNYSFNISCPDKPPTIEAWEPGGSPFQTYTQGDLITVTWIADDDKPLPPNPINISYGVPLSSWTTLSLNEANDGTYLWDTSSEPCPGTYWMNLSVYNSIGMETYDWSNFSFDVNCPSDNPPTIEVWEPGGTIGQIYTQGEMITVTWNADDNNPLPLNPINITYGVSLSSWTTISMNEVNDGTYDWATSSVLCPGTYLMNLSIYDSIGQKSYDWSNFSFEIVCPITYPPVIDNVEAEPASQRVGQKVTIYAEVTDEDTDVEDLTVNVNISNLDGALLGNYSMTCDSAGKCAYESNFNIEGICTFAIWANDTDGNWDYATGIFVMEPKPEEHNWKPLIALIFVLVLLHIGILVSYRRPIRFTGILGRDRVYTFLSGILPFVIVEALVGIISLFTGHLRVPPILGVGLIVDLIILILGLISCVVIFMKGNVPKSYEEEVQPPPPAHPSTPLPPPLLLQTESVIPVQAVKLCSKCGQELELEYIICPNCGAPA